MPDLDDNAENTADTNENSTDTQDAVNPLSMSDEDIANMGEAPDITSVGEPGITDDDNADDDGEQGSEDSEGTDDSESTTQEDDEEAADSDSDSSDDSGDGASDDNDADNDDDDASASKSSEDSNNTDTDSDSKDITATAVEDMKKLFSPFNANGKQMQIDNVDDAISLMQKGANYNKKMAGLKPNLKIVKMLENEGLLDAGKLANLIDLSKKNPKAIKQLIKDSGINPLDIDVKEDSGYTPETYSVSDAEVDLDMVLADLKASPKFKDTMDIISNKFDEPSKKVLVESPDIIRVISQHVELGIYDKIADEVEKERMLGRLTGMNDLEAYKHVGDEINSRGGFVKDLTPGTSSEKTDTENADTTEQTDNKTKARKEAKKAAAVTKSAKGKKPKDDYNPLSMSDEEIDNMPMSKFM